MPVSTNFVDFCGNSPAQPARIRVIDIGADVFRRVLPPLSSEAPAPSRAWQLLWLHNTLYVTCFLKRQLAGLSGLTSLDVSFNQITRIEGLEEAGLAALHSLFLANNKITKIEGLGGLPSLQLLELGSNRIRSIQQLEAELQSAAQQRGLLAVHEQSLSRTEAKFAEVRAEVERLESKCSLLDVRRSTHCYLLLWMQDQDQN